MQVKRCSRFLRSGSRGGEEFGRFGIDELGLGGGDTGGDEIPALQRGVRQENTEKVGGEAFSGLVGASECIFDENLDGSIQKLAAKIESEAIGEFEESVPS